MNGRNDRRKWREKGISGKMISFEEGKPLGKCTTCSESDSELTEADCSMWREAEKSETDQCFSAAVDTPHT